MDQIYSSFDANIIDAFRRSQDLRERFKHLLDPAAFIQNQRAEEELRDLANLMGYDEFPLPNNAKSFRKAA